MDSGSSQSSTPFIGDDKETGPAERPAARHRRGFLRGAPRQAWRDIQAARWGTFALCVLYLIWLAIILYVLVILGYLPEASRSLVGTGCQPDGSFSPYTDRFSWWGSSAFFQISLSAGKFTYADVKILDIACQLVIGRGGQALLAFLSWKAFRGYITTKMAESPVTFATFFVIFLQPEPTLVSTYRVIREFSIHRRPGSIATAIFIPITIIFTLVFPTAVNSMTGYMTVNSPYIEGRDGKMLPFEEFDRAAYVIHDGERINKTDDFIIPFHSTDQLISSHLFDDSVCTGDRPENHEGCPILLAASDYTKEHGFYGLKDEKTTWMKDVKLEAPALNVSGFFYLPGSTFYGYDWADPRAEDHASEFSPFQDAANIQFTYSGQLYDLDYIEEHGKCQPSSDTYRWGVSFAQAVIMLIALFIWTVGITIVWYDGHRRLPLAGQPEVLSGWPAVVELARAMEAEFRAAGIDAVSSTDREVKRRVRKSLRGGSVSFRERGLSGREGPLGATIWAGVKRERWWVGGFVLSFAAGFGVFFGLMLSPRLDFANVKYILGIFFWSMGLGIAAVLWLGSTSGSRIFLLSMVLLIVMIPTLTLLAH